MTEHHDVMILAFGGLGDFARKGNASTLESFDCVEELYLYN
jgi:hypothetical protein